MRSTPAARVFSMQMVHGALEAFADHRTHRAAEKLELEGAGDDGQAFERAGEGDQRVAFAGGLLRRREPVAVTLAVAKLERILGRYVGADFHLLAFVEKAHQALTAADAHVMAALRADIEISLELGAIQHRVAGRTLDPQTLGHRTRAALGLDARGHDFFEPGHVWRRIPERRLGRSAADDSGLRQDFPHPSADRAARTRPGSARPPGTGRPAARWRHWSCGRAIASTAATRSGGDSPCPTDISSPAMLRTMWCRKALAVMSIATHSPLSRDREAARRGAAATSPGTRWRETR